MKIVMLTGEGTSSKIVFHALSEQFPIDTVVIEGSGSRSVFLKKRVRKLGLPTVIGQVLFKLTAETILTTASRKRIREIKAQYRLDDSEISPDRAVRVDSVNGARCISLLRELRPDIIVINGTRIVSGEVLHCVDARFINMHAGITPKYRGVHGAYWALAGGDAAHCGVTVHFADEGIDTGAVLYQKTIEITPRDNFATYPFLQMAAGIELEKKAIADIINGCAKTVDPQLESKLYSHPTLCQYLKNRIKKGVK